MEQDRDSAAAGGQADYAGAVGDGRGRWVAGGSNGGGQYGEGGPRGSYFEYDIRGNPVSGMGAAAHQHEHGPVVTDGSDSAFARHGRGRLQCETKEAAVGYCICTGEFGFDGGSAFGAGSFRPEPQCADER